MLNDELNILIKECANALQKNVNEFYFCKYFDDTCACSL